MPYGNKPAHRSGETAWKQYMERVPPSLRDNYERIHRVITAYGKGKIEWYHLRPGETRYRTKNLPGKRGKVFAWPRIYNGWLCLFLPEHDPGFRAAHRRQLKSVETEYRTNFWYGKGQNEMALDVANPDFEEKLQQVLQLAQAALAAVEA